MQIFRLPANEAVGLIYSPASAVPSQVNEIGEKTSRPSLKFEPAPSARERQIALELGTAEAIQFVMEKRLGLRVRQGLKKDFMRPGTDTEKDLAGIWCEVLGIDKVGIQDNFF